MNTAIAKVGYSHGAWTALHKLAACANHAAKIGSDTLCIDIVRIIYDLYDECSVPVLYDECSVPVIE